MEEIYMKVVKYGALVVMVTLSLSVGLFAKDKNAGRFTLVDSVQVGSIELKAGDYKATWDGSGPDVQVKILQGKNVVATAPAKLVDNSSGQDSVTVGDPSKLLQQIHFGNLHKSLLLNPGTTGGDGSVAAQD
jgi:hypothetical protein